MGEFIEAAELAELPDQCARCIELRGKRIALYNLGGEIFATDDTCTHAEASLSEGMISGEEIVCPLHFATFNIRTGECTGPPATEDLQTYNVRIVDGRVQVEV